MIGIAATWILNCYYLLNATNVRSVKVIFLMKKGNKTRINKGSYYWKATL